MKSLMQGVITVLKTELTSRLEPFGTEMGRVFSILVVPCSFGSRRSREALKSSGTTQSLLWSLMMILRRIGAATAESTLYTEKGTPSGPGEELFDWEMAV